MSDHSAPSCSRRGVLAGVAAGALPVGLARAAPASVRPTVATWNAYIGVELDRLFEARSLEDVRTIAGDLLDTARSHPYEARAGAIADALVAADADVVALQEAALVRTGPTTGSGEGTETVVDLLEAVVSALDERGRSYEVAASSVTTDVSLPADAESGLVDLHLTDRVALLTAADAEVQSTEGGTYDERLRLPVPGTDRTVALERGYCRAALRFEGAAFTAVSTHLESASAPTRRQQAEELLDVLPGDGPVVVGADLNSGPGTTTTAHDTVTASLTDVHAELRPDSEGYTCCQPSSLRNDSSRLASRVDAVLTRDTSGLEAVERLGADPDDRVDATVDGESVAVWPSDHAGVAATVELSAPTATAQPARSDTDTATGTPAGTATPTDTARPTASTTARTEPTSGAGTGFGALAALLGVVAGASVRGRE